MHAHRRCPPPAIPIPSSACPSVGAARVVCRRVQKPPNAFQVGVQRVSHMLFGFIVAMAPVVVLLNWWMTGRLLQVRAGDGGEPAGLKHAACQPGRLPAVGCWQPAMLKS